MEVKDFLREQASDISRIYRNPLNAGPLDKFKNYEKVRIRPEGPFQRDFSRIMYSSSFRRLQGKMQLLGIREDQFFRNRLTHSLEVSQIARSIAYELNYDNSESYVVEAGALAHDLGNPPFGHSGEYQLNEMFKEIGGFEGNAQTLRILTNVEKKKPEFNGLNLTYRTLLSVVKYFKKYDSSKEGEKQKFIYDDDYDFLNDILLQYDIKVRTLDVQIVDLADEIAYAAHDLEDGLRLKYFTIDEILQDFYNKYDKESYEVLKSIVDDCRNISNYNGIDSSEYSKLFRQELTSKIINLLIHDIGLKEVNQDFIEKTGTKWDKELSFINYAAIAHGLKDITFRCINHNDTVFAYEQNGNKVIKDLVTIFRDKPMYLPPEYRADYILKQYKDEFKNEPSKKDLQERLICDYIAGMMDTYAITTHKKLHG